ncbi:3'-5' exonuclease [Streptococcus merionis]|uniref:3'-5' exonuclease n=1 Tax=Streptococcus merionis TaxID=400065 RepID=UPI003515A115
MSTNQRPFKGQSLVAKLGDYTVVDIETTGMVGKQARIIEISAIRVRDNQIVADFSMLINPHQRLTPFIKNLTGINDLMLSTAPELPDVLTAFYDFLGDDVIIGHNVHFDVNALYDNLLEVHGLQLTNDMVDTLRLSRRFLDLPHHRLDDLTAYFSLTGRHKHRALNDCRLTHAVYQKLCQFL